MKKTRLTIANELLCKMSKGKVTFKDIEIVKRNYTNPIMTGGNIENFIDEARIRAGQWSINRSLKNKNTNRTFSP